MSVSASASDDNDYSAIIADGPRDNVDDNCLIIDCEFVYVDVGVAQGEHPQRAETLRKQRAAVRSGELRPRRENVLMMRRYKKKSVVIMNRKKFYGEKKKKKQR